MAWWNKNAYELRDKVRDAEVSTQHYDEDDVRQATVHARQDIVLMVSYLSAVNSQLSSIKWGVMVIALFVIIIAVKV